MCEAHSASQGGVRRTAGRRKTLPPCEHLETAGTRRNIGSSSGRCSCSPMGSGGRTPTVRRKACVSIVILFYHAGPLLCVLCVSPPHSCHTNCSVSSAEVCRSGTWHTTSSAPEFPLSPRFYKAELGSHRLCLRPHPLGNRHFNMHISIVCDMQFSAHSNHGPTVVYPDI